MATASTSLSKIKANSLNLAGTFGFTGTVSGLADETPLVLISTFTSDGADTNATFTSSHITSTYNEFLFVFNKANLNQITIFCKKIYTFFFELIIFSNYYCVGFFFMPDYFNIFHINFLKKQLTI